jgi:hypothetical protein
MTDYCGIQGADGEFCQGAPYPILYTPSCRLRMSTRPEEPFIAWACPWHARLYLNPGRLPVWYHKWQDFRDREPC